MQRAGNQSRCFEDVKATRLDRDLGFIHATLCSCMCWLQADRSLGLRLIRANVGELPWPVAPRTKRNWHSAIPRRVEHGYVALAARCGYICVIAAGSRCCRARDRRDCSDRCNGKASAPPYNSGRCGCGEASPPKLDGSRPDSFDLDAVKIAG